VSQVRVSAAELRSRAIGSLAAHEQLQAAVLTFLRLSDVPAMPVFTGPRVRPRAGGGFELKHNAEQRGLFDVVACLPPLGRLLLVDLKTGKATLSSEQRLVHKRFTAAGALCLVVRELRDLMPHMPIGRARIQAHGGTR
jgi:hypothetical protein